MKTFFLTVIFITVCLSCADAQNTQPEFVPVDNEKMNEQLDSTMKAFDTLNQKINNTYKTTMDSANNRLEAVRNNKNLDQADKNDAQKRYVIGLLVLGVLIYGIMRKRKISQ